MTAIDAVPQRPENWLRGFRRLVDSSLARLDFDDFLAELLDRVRKVTDADTAAILLLDEDSQMLVARAASGIEEEIYQNVQVPIGHGFAGRIAAERRPVRLDKVTSKTVTNPILWQRGIRAMLGVPLTSEGSVVGVLHVGRLNERRFTQEDADASHCAKARREGDGKHWLRILGVIPSREPASGSLAPVRGE